MSLEELRKLDDDDPSDDDDDDDDDEGGDDDEYDEGGEWEWGGEGEEDNLAEKTRTLVPKGVRRVGYLRRFGRAPNWPGKQATTHYTTHIHTST